MAISILGPLNKVIYDTAKQVLDSGIPHNVAQVMEQFLSSSVEAVKKVTEEQAP